MTQPIDFQVRDTAIKRRIMNECGQAVSKHIILARLAKEYSAVWDPLECVWIFPDGSRCGCVQHHLTGVIALFFKTDVPERAKMS